MTKIKKIPGVYPATIAQAVKDANFKKEDGSVLTQSEINQQLKSGIDGKVDKVEGKGLSTEDFTTALKEKLNSLSNYDDTSVRYLIGGLQTAIDTLSGTNDATQVIDSMNEIKTFLENYKNTDSLASILQTLESTIHAWVESKGYVTSASAGGYVKPEGGIPKSDLASELQAELNGKADKVEIEKVIEENNKVTAASLKDLDGRLNEISEELAGINALADEIINE